LYVKCVVGIFIQRLDRITVFSLNIEATRSSEISEMIYHNTRRHISDIIFQKILILIVTP
jgi:hypothetical protein